MHKKAPEANGVSSKANGIQTNGVRTNGVNGVNGVNGHADIMTDDVKKVQKGGLANGLSDGYLNGNVQKPAQAGYHASRPEGADGVMNGDYAEDHHTNGD